MGKVINVNEMKKKLSKPYHTDSVIYADGRTSDKDEPTEDSLRECDGE